MLAVASPVLAADAGRVPKPVIEAGRGEKCVESTEFMRKNHMELLKHQRDETMHKGIRTTKYSLNGCIECHASRKNDSVVGSQQNFCQSCHSYAAVKLDCFECDNCVVYCPQKAVFKVNKAKSTTGRYVDTDYTRCIGCHICRDVCPTGYIQMGLGE